MTLPLHVLRDEHSEETLVTDPVVSHDSAKYRDIIMNTGGVLVAVM